MSGQTDVSILLSKTVRIISAIEGINETRGTVVFVTEFAIGVESQSNGRLRVHPWATIGLLEVQDN